MSCSINGHPPDCHCNDDPNHYNQEGVFHKCGDPYCERCVLAGSTGVQHSESMAEFIRDLMVKVGLTRLATFRKLERFNKEQAKKEGREPLTTGELVAVFDPLAKKIEEELAAAKDDEAASIRRSSSTPEQFFETLDAGLDAFNKMFCYIRILDAVARLSDFELFNPESFVKRQYADWFYNVGGAWRPIAPEWMGRADRNQRDGMTYAPGHKLYYHGKLNRWRASPITPVKGDISPWTELLDFMFPEAPVERKYFEQWIAYLLQHQGAKLMTALVLHSLAQGIGKNILFEAVEKIFGQNAIEIGETELYSDFNSWQKDRQLVIGNEVQGGRDKLKVIERIKMLITSPEITVNEKFKPQFSIPNVANFVFTSNNPDPFYVADTDRRFWVWEIPQAKPLPQEFYRRFHEWKESPEGIAALYWHLLHLDLTGFNPDACAPMTEAKQAMIELSRTELERWVRELPYHIDEIIKASGLEEYNGASNVTLFTLQDLIRLWKADGPKKDGDHAMLKALKKANYRQANGGKQVKVRCYPTRLWIVAVPEEAKRLETLKGVELSELYLSQRGNGGNR